MRLCLDPKQPISKNIGIKMLSKKIKKNIKSVTKKKFNNKNSMIRSNNKSSFIA
jgi:hypothetical protein